jgi:hypothetical protein
MRKINNWLDKPWTNRTYLKLSFWAILASWVISLLMMRKINRDFGIEKEKPKKFKKNENSLFDEVSTRDFRL